MCGRPATSQVDYDKYGMLGGNAEFTGTTWQNRVENDKGTQEQYGGKQSRNQDPGRFWKALGDKELHSNAQSRTSPTSCCSTSACRE